MKAKSKTSKILQIITGIVAGLALALIAYAGLSASSRLFLTDPTCAGFN